MLNDRHTSHQRKKSWPHRNHRPQRIQQTALHTHLTSVLFIFSFLFRGALFHTSTQNSLLRLLPALHCPTPRAWLTAHGKKNTTLYNWMPDSYKSWHAHKKAGKCPSCAVLARCHLQLWWATYLYAVSNPNIRKMMKTQTNFTVNS